jgi:hypothetical protein
MKPDLPEEGDRRGEYVAENAAAGLCAVTLDDLLLPRLSALVKAALDGGAPFVQYRNKIRAATAAPRPGGRDAAHLSRRRRPADHQ